MNRPALMYHDVVTLGAADASGFPGSAAAHYKLDIDAFRAHLDALAATGLRFGTVRDGEGCDALLTFDDGGASAVQIASELEVRDMRGHFFITTSRIGTPGFVSADDVRRLHAAGHVVGSHSDTHPAEISRLDDVALQAEWQRSVDRLTELLGCPVAVASVPGGFLSRRVAGAAAEAGIRDLFTSEPSVHGGVAGGCRLHGRYTLWRGMPARVAVALTVGEGGVRSRQWLAWNLKKPLKRLARPLYRWVRGRMLNGA